MNPDTDSIFDKRLKEVEAEVAEQRAQEERQRIADNFKEGTLTWSEYKALPANFRNIYESMHGKPENPAKRRATEKKNAKRKAAAKRAKQARKVHHKNKK